VIEINKKDLIKDLFPGFRILEFIILNEPITVTELEQYFSKSKSTYYRLLNKFIDFIDSIFQYYNRPSGINFKN